VGPTSLRRVRVLLFTGKGGVGKTTAAAGSAIRAGRSGLRTLVVSTDAAHSLADAFDQPIGPEPTAVGDQVWVLDHHLDRVPLEDLIDADFEWRTGWEYQIP